jgi:hypothetical protein
MLDPNSVKKVYDYLQVNKDAPLDRVLQDLCNPSPEQLREIDSRYLVKLSYSGEHSGTTEFVFLMDEDVYDLMQYQDLHLDDVDGRYSEVNMSWQKLEDWVIKNPRDVLFRIQELNLSVKHCTSLPPCVQNKYTDLMDSVERFMKEDYMLDILQQAGYSLDGPKPNTGYVGYNKFEDKRFYNMIDKAYLEMHDEGLHEWVHDDFQHAFVELIDSRWGGTSKILEEEQPWYEA